MRIGFDARMITHPGVGRYIKCLLSALVSQAPQDEFILFGSFAELAFLNSSKNVRIVKWDVPIYSVNEQFFLPYLKENLDLVHIPHFNIPCFYKKRMVVTIHDLIYLLIPNSAPSPLAKRYARFMIAKALQNAKDIISVSESTRSDLMRIFGTGYADKITVIPEAAGKAFHKIENSTLIEKVRAQYGLSGKIILYVGTIKPHKNLRKLIDSYIMLKKWGAPHQLVIAGRWDKKEDYLLKFIDGRDIKYLGEVPHNDLVVLYNTADLFVNLSLYEGFGLTILEAMQCGTPVVIARTSSLPEVAGSAALFVSPLNVGQTANTVYNILTNSQLREGMIRAGFSQAARFSWEKTAQETLKVYHKD